MGASFRLPRAQRIRKRPDFLRIQDSPVRVSTRHLLLLLSTGGEVSRLGVVASRKVGPAVVRNRCKRLVREVFRLHPEVFPPHVDVVIIVRPGTHLLMREELEGEVKGCAPQLARRARDLARRPA